MKANLFEREIEMSKAEAREAGKLGSKAYKRLREYVKAYPGYTVVIRQPARRKRDFDGLNYDYMYQYISASQREDKQKILEEFCTLTAYGEKRKGQSGERKKTAPYMKVKAWFLKNYPEIERLWKEQEQKIETILNGVA